jgi:UDP-glucose 4-epimerase
LAETLAHVMGFAQRLEYGPSRKVNPVSRRLADTREAKRLLDFTTEVSLEEGLTRLVHWWSQQRALQC